MQNSFEVVMVFESRLSCLKYPTSIDPTVAIGRTINIIFEFRKPPDEEQVENIFFCLWRALDKAIASVSVMIFGSCHLILILFVSSTRQGTSSQYQYCYLDLVI